MTISQPRNYSPNNEVHEYRSCKGIIRAFDSLYFPVAMAFHYRCRSDASRRE